MMMTVRKEKGWVRWRQHLTQGRGGSQGLRSARQVPYHCSPWPAATFYSFTIPAPLQSILLEGKDSHSQLACEHWHRMVRWWLSSGCQWDPTLALQALSINTPLLLPRMDCFFLSLSMFYYSSSRTLENSAPHSCALSCRSQGPLQLPPARLWEQKASPKSICPENANKKTNQWKCRCPQRLMH